MKLGKNVADCTEAWDVLKKGDDWSNNILSQKTVCGPSGKLGLAGEVDAPPDASELALCRQLADSAAEVAPDLAVGLGSDGGETFEPFFVAKHEGWRCDALKPAALRTMFGGALFPDATINAEPLEQRGQWWKEVEKYYDVDPEEDGELDDATLAEIRSDLDKWKRLVAWFQARKEFVELAFVAIDKIEKKNDFSMRGGCVFPRLLLGRTAGGSVAGLFGVVVYT